MEFSSKDKVALITGASRGIGQAVAIGLAQAGADVVIASRKLPDLEKVAEEIKKTGRKCLPVAAHVGKMEEISNLVKKVLEEFGKIDILEQCRHESHNGFGYGRRRARLGFYYEPES